MEAMHFLENIALGALGSEETSVNPIFTADCPHYLLQGMFTASQLLPLAEVSAAKAWHWWPQEQEERTRFSEASSWAG